MTIIRYTEKADPVKDAEVEGLCQNVLQKVEQGTIKEFTYCNVLVLMQLRAMLYRTHRHLQNKIIWMVNHKEVTFDQDMRSEDIWNLVPNTWDKAIETLLG